MPFESQKLIRKINLQDGAKKIELQLVSFKFFDLISARKGKYNNSDTNNKTQALLLPRVW